MLAACLAAAAGCASRAADVRPQAFDAAAFAGWSCDRLHDEIDLVQQQAADAAWAVDERAGHNVIALGLGVTVFWPALLAMRPDGLEADDLARLKGRHEALVLAAGRSACPTPPAGMRADLAATLPVRPGDRLVYEERTSARGAVRRWALEVVELRRDGIDFVGPPIAGQGARQPWRQDLAGNLQEAPDGVLRWPRLLRRGLELGQVVAGEIAPAGDPMLRARVRGQVVAVGPQQVGPRRFDVAVVELFGDALQGEGSSRLDGVIVVDRASGVLLRLALRSSVAALARQRRLVQVEAAAGLP